MVRRAPALAGTLTLALLAPSPAWASLDELSLSRTELSAPDRYGRPRPDPGVASTLSWTVPLGLALVTLPLGPFSLLAGGLGAGAGHFYAGDAARGVLFGIGGLAAPSLGVAAGMGLGIALAGSNQAFNSLGAIAVTGIATGLVTAVGYLIVASRDAYEVAESRRDF